MIENRRFDHELDKLSKAVIKAIENSGEVKKILKRLQSEEVITPETMLVLLMKPHPVPITKKKQQNNKKNDKNYTKIKYGQMVSPMEMNFEEFSRKKFDQKTWLKKLGLKL
jgi:hypothetical protein